MKWRKGRQKSKRIGKKSSMYLTNLNFQRYYFVDWKFSVLLTMHPPKSTKSRKVCRLSSSSGRKPLYFPKKSFISVPSAKIIAFWGPLKNLTDQHHKSIISEYSWCVPPWQFVNNCARLFAMPRSRLSIVCISLEITYLFYYFCIARNILSSTIKKAFSKISCMNLLLRCTILTLQ